MVVKIMPPTGGMSASITYNERKVSAGEAEVICRMNMDSDRDTAVRETFARYERLNIRSAEVSFHMSVNPGLGEKLDDTKAVELVCEIMKELGYGKQPLVVYRHNDIEREHFHVLSIRVNDKGRKIPSFQEQNRCRRFLESIKDRYGFTLGSKEAVELSEKGINPKLFNHRAGNVSAQMDAVFEKCLKYHFTSFSQFERILADHNLAVKNAGRRLYLQGLDPKGRKCTRPVGKRDLLSRMLDRMQLCMDEDRSKAAHRVALIGAALLPYSNSELHYRNMMLKKNIHVLFDKDSSGKITGAMYIDHEGRNAFGADELGHELSLSMIQDADRNQWEHNESQHTGISVGELLFAPGNHSKGHEKDPKYIKKKPNAHHL